MICTLIPDPIPRRVLARSIFTTSLAALAFCGASASAAQEVSRAEYEQMKRELARLSEMEVARVICEGCWNAGPPRRPNESDNEYNERAPKHFRSVLGSVRSWMLEFPKVHWVQCANRRQAELECFRTLEMWWRKRETQI